MGRERIGSVMSSHISNDISAYAYADSTKLVLGLFLLMTECKQYLSCIRSSSVQGSSGRL